MTLLPIHIPLLCGTHITSATNFLDRIFFRSFSCHFAFFSKPQACEQSMFLFSFTRRRAREERRQKTFAHLPPPPSPFSNWGPEGSGAGETEGEERKRRGNGNTQRRGRRRNKTYKHFCAPETQTFIIKRLSRNLSSAQ